jgi:uncharacterized membrane protein YkvA (DUF1232 family)
MEGDVIGTPDPQPDRSGHDTAPLAVVRYPLDTAEPIPVKTRQEMLKEVALLVPNLAKLLFRLLRDGRVPLRRRLVMGAVGVYVVSPIDLIPDAIPIIGGIDDVLVLAFAIDYLLEATPDDVIAEHWDGSDDGLELVRGVAAWGVEMLPDRLRRLVDDRRR